MGLFGNLFSKQTCGVCGKEVGALARLKLKDGKYVCRDCGKNASAFFNVGHHDLESTKKHLAYMEKANELYQKEFENLDKEQVDYCNHHGSYKIGFVDSIGMFAVLTPETKRRNKKELFRYDQIDSFGPYTEMNSMNRKEGERAIKEYGVLIKMRCAEDFARMNASEAEKKMMHPHAIEIKIPIQHNVDNPSGGDRIFAHLGAIFGGKKNGALEAASDVASMLLGSSVGAMIPSGDFSDADRAKYTKLADEVEKRAVGKALRDI